MTVSCEKGLAIIRQSMDRDEPGWIQTSYFCPPCREWHEIIAGTKQLQLSADAPVDAAAPTNTRRLPPLKPGAPEGWCRWHDRASPQLSAPCAFCGTPVHVHRDALGKVKSGAAEHGYLTERCPACHRYNAVHPTYGKSGIRTSKLEGDTPVMQMTMGRMG